MSDPVRLAKRVAGIARCPRIEAEQCIKGGRVSVDGVVVEDPAHPASGGTVVLDPDARLETVEIEQEFVVEVCGDIAPYGLRKLDHGLHYNGRALPACKDDPLQQAR